MGSLIIIVPSGISAKTLRSLVLDMKQMGLLFHVLGNFDRDKGRNSHLPRIAADKKLVGILENEFGWKPRVSLENGIKETIDWVQNNFDDLIKEPMEYFHKK